MSPRNAAAAPRGLDLLGADPEVAVGAYGVLGDLVRDAERELAEAKARAGALPRAFGRFQDAEAELAALRGAPDQADARKKAALLIQGLRAYQAEPPPRWLAIPAVGAGGAFLVSGVVGHLTKNMPVVHPAVAVAQGAAKAAPLLGGLVVLGGLGVFVIGQLATRRPSSKTGLELQWDADESKKKAASDLAETMREQDRKDTEAILRQTAEYQQERSRRAAVEASKSKAPQVTSQPSWVDRPGGRKFGYWKGGQFVEVPIETTIERNGKLGRYNAAGAFIPYAGE